MTYNFDPDKWLENEIYMLSHKMKSKQISQQEYDLAVESLEKKHEQMWQRLDGTYRIGPESD